MAVSSPYASDISSYQRFESRSSRLRLHLLDHRVATGVATRVTVSLRDSRIGMETQEESTINAYHATSSLPSPTNVVTTPEIRCALVDSRASDRSLDGIGVSAAVFTMFAEWALAISTALRGIHRTDSYQLMSHLSCGWPACR